MYTAHLNNAFHWLAFCITWNASIESDNLGKGGTTFEHMIRKVGNNWSNS